ncbi:hypothetical protein DERP_008326 [Dermatophagoides pteronyssinus]|uniref:Uncharacterized protein n=1 Tax=Dermatophagoides pteronyssinus TaxID=6956 RepID=A0ABQ8J655_DERPT|nr:hypothetical protein DERP_008326 [Dermatophagoides pteronyssinus]
MCLSSSIFSKEILFGDANGVVFKSTCSVRPLSINDRNVFTVCSSSKISCFGLGLGGVGGETILIISLRKRNLPNSSAIRKPPRLATKSKTNNECNASLSCGDCALYARNRNVVYGPFVCEFVTRQS